MLRITGIDHIRTDTKNCTKICPAKKADKPDMSTNK
jgi:hypothetical protein